MIAAGTCPMQSLGKPFRHPGINASIEATVSRRICLHPLALVPPNRQDVRHTLLIPSKNRCWGSSGWHGCPDHFVDSFFFLSLFGFSPFIQFKYKGHTTMCQSHAGGQKLKIQMLKMKKKA